MARYGYCRHYVYVLNGGFCGLCEHEQRARELRRVLEEDAERARIGRIVDDVLDKRYAERNQLIAMLADVYYTAHREGWEPGESTDEVLKRAHDLLCNLGFDPYTNGGPAKLIAIGSVHAQQEATK